jgi:hypothetical protein
MAKDMLQSSISLKVDDMNLLKLQPNNFSGFDNIVEIY